MSRNITITYELNPPQGSNQGDLQRSRTLSFPAPNVANGAGANKKYYDDLRSAVAQARDVVGNDLTAWRDAVGNLEQAKEPKISKEGEEEEDEDDAEGEQ